MILARHKVFGVTGWKNSGKTTLVTRLVENLTGRGYRISTVKHAHHTFDIDQEGRDSHRHRLAGAGEVAVVSGARWAIMHELRGESEPPVEAIVERLSPCDLVLIEGYKREGHPKIELLSSQARRDTPIWPEDPSIVAVACDRLPVDCTLPVFQRDEIDAIASFVIGFVGLGEPGARS